MLFRSLLWTRKEVADLVKRQFGITTLSLPTIIKYLKSWGLSPQRPNRKSYEQNPVAVRECWRGRLRIAWETRCGRS